MKLIQFSGGACALIGAGFMSAAAQGGIAQPGHGLPIMVPFDHAEAHVEFVYADAMFSGNLYFMGMGDPLEVHSQTPSNDLMGLGQFLFNNHGSALGQTESLIGVFNEGDVLHFGYSVQGPPADAVDLFRTDVAADQLYFRFDALTGELAIEDIRDQISSDFDYNDLIFRITFSEVPAPGAMALLGMAGMLCLKRRRQRS